jgi:acetoacetate decarboxylase
MKVFIFYAVIKYMRVFYMTNKRGLPVTKWGYSNPIISPLYPPPPIIWKDVEVLLVLYETDEENIWKVIPEPLEVAGNKVIAWISYFPASTQGTFYEAALYVQVKYGNYVGVYEPFLYVTSEVPLCGGREIWGYQKKLANITLRRDPNIGIAVGEVERGGVKIIKAFTHMERAASFDELPFGPIFSLKYIPPSEEGGKPFAELIVVDGGERKVKYLFAGKSTLILEKSEADPTYILEPKRVIAGYYGILETLTLPYGKVVYRYSF